MILSHLTNQIEKAQGALYERVLTRTHKLTHTDLNTDNLITSAQRGDAGQGRWICAGHLPYSGQRIRYTDDLWSDSAIKKHHFWNQYANSFEWLAHLKALGGDAGRLQARELVKEWIQHHKKQKIKSLQAGSTGRRISNWLLHFDFYGETAPNNIISDILNSIANQAALLSKFPHRHIPSHDVIHVCKGLIFTGLCIKGQEKYLYLGLDLLKKSIDEQILQDGMHISRSPDILVEWGLECLDIINIMRKSRFHEASFLPPTLDRIAQAIRFFASFETTPPLFNGSCHRLENKAQIFLKNYSGRGKKAISLLEQGGYARIKKGQTSIIVDSGAAPEFKHNSFCHAAPGAMELYLGREKIVTNCGSHMLCPSWSASLKSTAAHSTLTLDDRNACEILQNGHLGDTCRPPHLTYNNAHNDGNSTFIEITHEGYMSSLSTSHTRRIICTANGGEIIGQDILAGITKRDAPLEYTIRFHLSPMTNVNLIKNQTEALIRLQSGKGASFIAHNKYIRIEDSVVIGKDLTPRKTKQIVIEGRYNGSLETADWIFKINT